MQRKYSVATIIISVIIAMFITFEATYLLCEWRNRLDYRDLSESYNSSIDEIDELYREEIEHLVAEIEALRGTYSDNEVLAKLALIDYLYRSLYVHEGADSETLQTFLADTYIYAMGDKYAHYYTKEEYEELTKQNGGSLVGIGVQVIYDAKNGGIDILLVMEDSPALEAGLKKGDLITHVDGEKVTDLGYENAVAKIKGESGTKVNVTVLREGKEIKFEIVRRAVESQSVIYHKFALDEKIGVIKILEFNSLTPKQFKKAVKSLLDDGAESLVFDMRDNPGGLLDAVVEMLDYLLPAGDIVHIVKGNGELDRTYKSDAACVNVPMAVLTNENTASAAELFTSSLKDYDKVTIIGTKTYGKGTVQSIIPLGDGTAISISTYMYNPPKSENYEGKGITPDIVVEPNEILKNKHILKVEDSEDNQLVEACRQLGYEK